MFGSALEQAGNARNGKCRYVDLAGNQDLLLLPAAGHQFLALVQPELFHRAFSAFQGPLSLHQRLLVPLCAVAEQGLSRHPL